MMRVIEPITRKAELAGRVLILLFLWIQMA